MSYLLCLCVISVLTLGSCQQERDISNLELLRGDIILCSGEDFGEVSFSLSCKYSVRETFNLAVALLHSFEYGDAERMFAKVIDADPECAMAYWGIAMSNFYSLWEAQPENGLQKGSAAIKIARGIQVKSLREEEYIDAIGQFYDNWDESGHEERAQRFEQSMERIYVSYPDDQEAAIFYALALIGTADKQDKTYAHHLKAGEILKEIFPDEPSHPGIAHYLIHTYDTPELAPKGLEAARMYASIAPGSAHALHMPSHIFTRLGLWDESIASNIASVEAALCYAENAGYAGYDGHWSAELHALDYLVYAYLQQARDDMVLELGDYIGSIHNVIPFNFAAAYAFVAIPARIAFEQKNWEGASKLKLYPSDANWKDFPWQLAIHHYARAMGGASIGDVELAKEELKKVQLLHMTLVAANEVYQAYQVEIQIKVVKAWMMYAEGEHDIALALMHEAADMEDLTDKNSVTPGELVPARELLGDLLLAMDMPREALLAYEVNMERHPNRFNGVYGAAVSAEGSGRLEKANKYYRRIGEVASSWDGHRQGVKEALTYLDEQ